MASAARKVLQDALNLSPKARLALAADLIASVEVPGPPVGPAEWDRAWSKELDARWAAAERTGDWGEPWQARRAQGKRRKSS
jgi:hypothetical protein